MKTRKTTMPKRTQSHCKPSSPAAVTLQETTIIPTPILLPYFKLLSQTIELEKSIIALSSMPLPATVEPSEIHGWREHLDNLISDVWGALYVQVFYQSTNKPEQEKP